MDVKCKREGEANKPIAGEYHAIALDLQGVGAAQLAAHKAKLEATKTKLEQFQANPDNTTLLNGLTKEDLSGDLLYSGILGYFASVDSSDKLAEKTGNQVVNYRMPSYGAFMAKANPHYWFGIVRSVSFPGVVMDVDRVFYQVAAKDDDKLKQVAYMRQVGAAGSAFEHAVPERLFADPSKPLNDPTQPQGVSAVKAIAIAASQGQKVYTLNAQNLAYHAQIVAQLQIDADTRQEISNALSAGKEVTVHQAEITVDGWTGCGYIMLDPDTGAGAYKISGGANGGWLVFFGALLIILQIILAFVASSAAILAIGGAIALLAGVLIGLSLANDPMMLANFAGARLVAAVATITLLVVVEGYVLLPLAAIIGVAIAIAAAGASLISLFLKMAIIQNGIEFPSARRQTSVA